MVLFELLIVAVLRTPALPMSLAKFVVDGSPVPVTAPRHALIVETFPEYAAGDVTLPEILKPTSPPEQESPTAAVVVVLNELPLSVKAKLASDFLIDDVPELM
jgi:hypothetical protein